MKRNYIDSIRGIAILMVVLVHTGQITLLVSKSQHFTFIQPLLVKYGQMGVQLFFVASAYTLCLSSFNRKNETNKFTKYAIRRYFRIAPAYYIA